MLEDFASDRVDLGFDVFRLGFVDRFLVDVFGNFRGDLGGEISVLVTAGAGLGIFLDDFYEIFNIAFFVIVDKVEIHVIYVLSNDLGTGRSEPARREILLNLGNRLP